MEKLQQQPRAARGERVVVVDRLASVRSALFLILSHQPDITIVGDRASIEGLPEYLLEVEASILLLDWTLVGENASDLLSAIRANCPGLLIIALSARPEDQPATEQAGADGFACKGDEPASLLTLIRHLVRR